MSGGRKVLGYRLEGMKEDSSGRKRGRAEGVGVPWGGGYLAGMHKASTKERSLHGQYSYYASIIFLIFGARHSHLNLKDEFRRLPAINQRISNAR